MQKPYEVYIIKDMTNFNIKDCIDFINPKCPLDVKTSIINNARINNFITITTENFINIPVSNPIITLYKGMVLVREDKKGKILLMSSDAYKEYQQKLKEND